MRFFKKILGPFILSTIFLLGFHTGDIVKADGPDDVQTEDGSDISDSSEVLKVAKGLIGTPYISGGTTKKGFDCSGFVGYAYSAVGVDLPRTSASMYSKAEKVEVDALEAGDLVFFATGSTNSISHVGIYVGNNKFIHSSSSKGVRIDSINMSYWKTKFVAGRSM